MSAREHPVWTTLRHAAQGARLTESELDELRLAPEQRRAVVAASRTAAALANSGEKQDARRLADITAGTVIGALSEEQQDPDFYKPTPDDPHDPAALAAMVSRGW